MTSGDLSAVGQSAFAVALARASEAARGRPWFIDPVAVRLAAAVPQAAKERVGVGLTAWIAVRTRFLDELVLRSVGRGVRQIVILGAGLDSRAFRLSLPDEVALYEVDHREVFAAKQRILNAAGLHSARRREVVADVLDAGWLAAPEVEGWQREEPTLWILEGYLMAFDAETRTRIVTELAAASAIGSVLGATVSTRVDMRSPLWQPLDQAHVGGWLSECGWTAELTDMEDASKHYGRPLPSDTVERMNGALIVARLNGDDQVYEQFELD
ncbi:class I SAM-dependent methyltransferase [Rathayibacter soli]|uniref:class I SAM-dependent methyltransferase n=1 Tax=Rathayibacter soli TaxID=3144168 RepID=UPI0027E59AFA|nr:SAM-dependent methyltransferase [Glaciibacter superstes]